MKTIGILLVLVFGITFNTHAQEKTFPERNTIVTGVSLGALDNGLALYADMTFSYERILVAEDKFQIGGQIGLGGYAVWGAGGYKVSPRAVMLVGGGNSHLETTLGTNFFVLGDLEGYKPFIPAGSIGYRYQKPDGGFVFRSAVGFREFIQLGIGYSF